MGVFDLRESESLMGSVRLIGGRWVQVGDFVEINYKGHQLALIKEIIVLQSDNIFVLLFPDMREEFHTHSSLLNIMAFPLDKS